MLELVDLVDQNHRHLQSAHIRLGDRPFSTHNNLPIQSAYPVDTPDVLWTFQQAVKVHWSCRQQDVCRYASGDAGAMAEPLPHASGLIFAQQPSEIRGRACGDRQYAQRWIFAETTLVSWQKVKLLK